MTRTEIIRKANELRKAAEKAEGNDRNVLLRKARNYFQEAGLDGMAGWCEKFIR